MWSNISIGNYKLIDKDEGKMSILYYTDKGKEMMCVVSPPISKEKQIERLKEEYGKTQIHRNT